MRLVLFLLPWWCSVALALAAEAPQFAQFPVEGEAFRGTPARPRPRSRNQLTYRTAIREGAKDGPNFAGHYTIVGWGCGSGCFGNAIVDAKTGEVFDFPFEYMTLGARDYGAADASPAFRLDSRLLILRGCPREDNTQCAIRYYQWTGGRFQLLSMTPITK